MDISDIPEWFFDIQLAKKTMQFGRIPLELVVSGGEVSKVIGTRSDQIRFQPHEQEQRSARLWVVDLINSMKTDGTTTFSVIHKGPIIKQINFFDTVEYSYKPGSKQ